MGKLLLFKRKTPRKVSTLCLNNHHKWKIVTERKFDVKQGKLVTVEQCERCRKTRHRLT